MLSMHLGLANLQKVGSYQNISGWTSCVIQAQKEGIFCAVERLPQGKAL